MAKTYLFYNKDNNTKVSATRREFREKLEGAGYEEIDDDINPDGVQELTVQEAIGQVQEEQIDADNSEDGDAEVESDGGVDGGDTSVEPDEIPAPKGNNEPGDEGQAEAVGGDEESGAGEESEPDADQREEGRGRPQQLRRKVVYYRGDAPDPNNYDGSDELGFIENRAAGGAIPGAGSRDFVNGVDHETPGDAGAEEGAEEEDFSGFEAPEENPGAGSGGGSIRNSVSQG